MKVLIADKFSEKIVKDLQAQHFQINYNDKLNGESLKNEIASFQPEVLVVRSTKVQLEHLEASNSLKSVVRAGSGFDNIDVKSANLKGIQVSNVPGKNSVAVCELVWGLILAIDRRIPDNVIQLKQKQWNKDEFSKSLGIKGRTLGIIGFGNIGTEVAHRALAFDMNVVAYDVVLLPQYYNAFVERKNFKFVNTIDELIKESDVVTIHVPSLESTKNMVNKQFLSKMKPDATLINTSRSTLVVENDLIEHLNANKNFWFGADVFSSEPAEKKCAYDNQLAQHPQVYGTHHIGASTKQSEDSIGERTYEMLIEYSKTRTMPHCVNLGTTKTQHTLRLKYVPQPQLYSDLYTLFSKHNVTVFKSNFENYPGNQVGVATLAVETQLQQDQRNALQAEISSIKGVVDAQLC